MISWAAASGSYISQSESQAASAWSDRAFLRVETPAIIRELIGKLYSALRLTFKNFIAYAPGNNRRMAAVAPYERVEVLLPPLPISSE